MSAIVERTFELFRDPSISTIKKVLMIFSVMVVALFINHIVGFTYHYKISRRIEGLEKLEQLKRSSKTDTLLYNQLTGLEYELLYHSDLADWMGDLASSRFFASSYQLINNTSGNKNGVTKQNNPINSSKQLHRKVLIVSESISDNSLFWHVFSSSFGILIILIISPIYDLIQHGDKSSVQILSGILIDSAVLVIITIINSGLFWLIPYFSSSHHYYNYIFNAIIHLGIIILGFSLSEDQRETERANTRSNPVIPPTPNQL